MYLALIAIWIFNIPVFAVIPVLLGVLIGIILPYVLIIGFYWEVLPSLWKCLRRVKCWRIITILATLPVSLLFTFALYPVILYLSVALLTTFSALIAALLVAFASPTIMLFIPCFILKIIFLSIRGLR